MFLFEPFVKGWEKRFPRVCGDVPTCTNLPQKLGEFSPRMRGCSLLLCGVPITPYVFPAYAGMFRYAI